ncbi:hypothetical protein D3C78_1904740 [compost metagenome]
MAQHFFARAAEQFADLAVGVLVAQLGVLDVDEGLDTVEDGVQAQLAGTQVAGLLRHPAAQQQRAAQGEKEQRTERGQAPP